MPVTALPSDSYTGGFSDSAKGFIDILSDCGVTFWQILPLTVTGKGNSPYSSPSAFAISPLYLDKDSLEREGFINLPSPEQNISGDKINYTAALSYADKLSAAAARQLTGKEPEYISFCENNAYWLKDYAIFTAATELVGSTKLKDFPTSFKKLDEDSESGILSLCSDKIEKVKRVQFLLRRQWDSIRAYAAKKQVKIIGDIPIYVSANSADVFAHPEIFSVGNDLTPLTVAGVPPDSFSKTGQLWGNPVYNWTVLKNTDYDWWLKRLSYSFELCDWLRIDHFRAFASYYSIPYGKTDATGGVWQSAPGKEFFDAVSQYLNRSEIIAEDLGGNTPDVKELLRYTRFPGMKITQFEFQKKTAEDCKNTAVSRIVSYTGTHDNDTAENWYLNLTPSEKAFFEKTTPFGKFPSERLVRYTAASKADLCIFPVQDILGLGKEARFNTPGVEQGNWEWRINKEQMADLGNRIIYLLKDCGRLEIKN